MKLMDIRVQKKPPPKLPKPRGFSKERLAKYPYATVKVGESFLLDESVGRAAYRMARDASKDGKVFKVHKVGHDWRCWRVR